MDSRELEGDLSGKDILKLKMLENVNFVRRHIMCTGNFVNTRDSHGPYK